MNYKHCCVVGADGAYKTFVLVLLEQGEDGETTENVQGYKMAEDERLLDVHPPIIKNHAGSAGFVKPRWDDDTAAWVEGATAEELAAWETEHPAPEVPEPEPSGGDAAQAVQEVWDEMAAAIREGVNGID